MSTITFRNSISILPFLILERTCERQAYRKAYWPSPNNVCFPVKVYSWALSGSHCWSSSMTWRETESDIVSVPESFSIYGLLFTQFSSRVIFQFLCQLCPVCALTWEQAHPFSFFHSHISIQPVCKREKKTLGETLEWPSQCLHEFMWLL